MLNTGVDAAVSHDPVMRSSLNCRRFVFACHGQERRRFELVRVSFSAAEVNPAVEFRAS